MRNAPTPNLLLEEVIGRARSQHFRELYELDSGESESLEQTTGEVLLALGSPLTNDQSWRCLGILGRAALQEVVPTIAFHWPPGLPKTYQVRDALDRWLAGYPAPPVVTVFSPSPLVAPQALGEALSVVHHAGQLLDRNQAGASYSEILDDVLQGYAVFPGSKDRRALFDWWLDSVLTASVLQPPGPFVSPETKV